MDWEGMFNRAYARAHTGRSYSHDLFRPIKRVDDYGLPKEWGSLRHIPSSKRAEVEAKLSKLQKMKHLGATEGERAAGASAFERFKAAHQLMALLDNLIEFGDISISTAKKVIRDLEVKSGPNPAKLVRPKFGIPNYVYPGMTAAERMEVKNLMHVNKVPLERSVIVPRTFPEGVEGNPLHMRLHETGHAADPHMDALIKWRRKAKPVILEAMKKGNMAEVEKRGIGMAKSILNSERRANMGVLTSIQTHGTPGEAMAWKKAANAQMKLGYRKPIFNAATSAGLFRPTLTQMKQLLKQVPELRGKVLNLESQSSDSSSNVIHFGRMITPEMILEKIRERREQKTQA